MGPSLGLCLWQIFNKLYWLSDSRGWFLIGATKGKGSSRNLLVVVVVVDQARKTMHVSYRFPSHFSHIHHKECDHLQDHTLPLAKCSLVGDMPWCLCSSRSSGFVWAALFNVEWCSR